jgi:competence protein ComEC
MDSIALPNKTMYEANKFQTNPKLYILLFLFLSNIAVWLGISTRDIDKTLNVYFLDVGQGDSILIESPTHGRVLIDGGRNGKVLSEIGTILPFNDRKIDVVIGTHPDSDHIGGLAEVVERYDVGAYIHPNVSTDKKEEDELFKRLEQNNIPKIFAKRGMVVNFGDGARLLVLFPNQDVSRWDTNDASVVARLEYGERSFLLTGDSPVRVENILVNQNKELIDVDVLKAGHHGSRTSTSLSFARAVSPEYAVISAGKITLMVIHTRRF